MIHFRKPRRIHSQISTKAAYQRQNLIPFFGVFLSCALVSIQSFSQNTISPENPWEKILSPITKEKGNDTSSQSVGFYSLGCMLSSQKLDVSTASWEVANIFRNRYYGQPKMIRFLTHLSREVLGSTKKKIVIGDVSLPGGGPTNQGHASHQNGLDVDIRYRFVKEDATLTEKERNDFEAPDICIHKVEEVKKGKVTEYNIKSQLFDKKLPEFIVESLRVAASYPETERIFVSPPIKKALCEKYKSEYPRWLLKISPYFGHSDHYHVRLSCPEDSSDCKKQDPITVHPDDTSKVGCAGSGINWWYSTDLKKDSFFKESVEEIKKGPQPPSPPSWIGKICKLPQRCRNLVDMSAFKCPPEKRAEFESPTELLFKQDSKIPIQQLELGE